MELNDVVVLGPVRTPTGLFGGTLRDIPAYDMGAVVIAEALKKVKSRDNQIDEAILGQYHESENDPDPSATASVRGGTPMNVQINRNHNDTYTLWKKFDSLNILRSGNDFHLTARRTLYEKTYIPEPQSQDVLQDDVERPVIKSRVTDKSKVPKDHHDSGAYQACRHKGRRNCRTTTFNVRKDSSRNQGLFNASTGNSYSTKGVDLMGYAIFAHEIDIPKREAIGYITYESPRSRGFSDLLIRLALELLEFPMMDDEVNTIDEDTTLENYVSNVNSTTLDPLHQAALRAVEVSVENMNNVFSLIHLVHYVNFIFWSSYLKFILTVFENHYYLLNKNYYSPDVFG